MNENMGDGFDEPTLDAASEAAIDALLQNAQFITPPPGPVADRFTAMLAIEVAQQEKAQQEAAVYAAAEKVAVETGEDAGAEIIAFKPRAKWIAPISIAAALVLVAGVGIGVTQSNLFSSNSSSSVPLASDTPLTHPLLTHPLPKRPHRMRQQRLLQRSRVLQQRMGRLLIKAALIPVHS